MSCLRARVMRIDTPDSVSFRIFAISLGLYPTYIDENYNEAISLDKLAEIAHVNKYYLSHSFKKEYGSSPIDYMLKRRITEAKALLSSTDYSLIQIAEQLGFGSPAYFSKCFRKVEGISPSGYRCALQQKAAKRSE